MATSKVEDIRKTNFGNTW